MNQKIAIGVDIGGTSVKLGIVSAKGRVLASSSFLTEKTKSRKKQLETLAAHILELIRRARDKNFRVLGLGIGAPGPIDVEKGFVHFFPNIPGWKSTPLKKILQKKLKLPVFIDNDANAMALGEFLFGAGRGAKNIVALTLGTGIGGGLVMDGKLFHGPAYSAAEIGHLVINENGPQCGCGSRGCIETYVGNGYFVKEVQRRLKAGQKSVLKSWLRKKAKLTPLLVAQAARKGDRFSREIWRETGEHLGTALTGLVNILNPEKIILGGGIAQNGKFLFHPVVKTLQKKAFPIAARSVKVVRAALGVDAGLIGAAALVFVNGTK